MKFAALLSLVIATGVATVKAATSEPADDNFLQYRDECIDLLELDEEDFRKSKPTPTTTPELEELLVFDAGDRDSLALWKCIMKKEKVVNAKGQYQLDAFKEWLPEAADAVDFEECMKFEDVDPCMAAHKTNKCFVEKLYSVEDEEK